MFFSSLNIALLPAVLLIGTFIRLYASSLRWDYLRTTFVFSFCDKFKWSDWRGKEFAWKLEDFNKTQFYYRALNEKILKPCEDVKYRP